MQVGRGEQTTPTFGVYAPQGWKGELSVAGSPTNQWIVCRGFAREAERLGYRTLWLYDHLHTVPEATNETLFECWIALTALATATTNIRLGPMMSCASYRNPALVAKMAATLDIVSDGRLEFGIGAGWAEQEYRSYGFGFPTARDRVAQIRESIEIVSALWSDDVVSYEGRFHSVEGAWCSPKPLQKPRPPIWVGGSGESLLRVAARLADRANFGGPLNLWRDRLTRLRAHCADIGRPVDDVAPTLMAQTFVRESHQELRACFEAGVVRSLRGEDFDTWSANHLVGTPDVVAERIAEYERLGCAHAALWCADAPSHETLELFAKKVASNWQ
jgi:F420-dependent oxidoreductase-like protein